MATPYNTGKVLIGCAIPPRSPQNDVYMDQIQSALIKPGKTVVDYRRSEALAAMRETAAILVGFAAFLLFSYLAFPIST